MVLVGGKEKVGKDTLGLYFIGKNFKRYAFADEIKVRTREFLESVFGINVPLHWFHDQLMKDKVLGVICSPISMPVEMGTEITIRKAMQGYGKMIKDNFGEDYWIKFLVDKIRNEGVGQDIIITDIRFPREISVIKGELENDYNIQTVRIKRDTGIEDGDISECALDFMGDGDFDFVIKNDGSIEKLWEKCVKFHVL